MRPDLHGGGQHHQASALIGLEAFRAAGDPRRYPEQIAEGLWPWQASKIYKVGYYGFFRGEPEPPKGTKLVAVESDVYDPLLGRTYAEIGSEARAMHKCQGFGQLLALPGSLSVKYQLADTTIPGQAAEGRDRSRRRPGPVAARTCQIRGSPAARTACGRVSMPDRRRGRAPRHRPPCERPGRTRPSPHWREGMSPHSSLRAELSRLGLSDAAWYEVDVRLERTEASVPASVDVWRTVFGSKRWPTMGS